MTSCAFAPGGVLHRGREVDEAVRALADRLAVGPVDGEAIDEDRAQVAVFRRALRGDVQCEAGRQQGVSACSDTCRSS